MKILLENYWKFNPTIYKKSIFIILYYSCSAIVQIGSNLGQNAILMIIMILISRQISLQ